MAKHGVEFKPRVKLVKLCKAEYAQSVLASDRHISTMMPCTFIARGVIFSARSDCSAGWLKRQASSKYGLTTTNVLRAKPARRPVRQRSWMRFSSGIGLSRTAFLAGPALRCALKEQSVWEQESVIFLPVANSGGVMPETSRRNCECETDIRLAIVSCEM